MTIPVPKFKIGDLVEYEGVCSVVDGVRRERFGAPWTYLLTFNTRVYVPEVTLKLVACHGDFERPAFRPNDAVYLLGDGPDMLTHVRCMFMPPRPQPSRWLFGLTSGEIVPANLLRAQTYPSKKDFMTPKTPVIKSYSVHTVTYDDGTLSLSVTIPKDKQDVRLHGRSGEVVAQIPVALLRRVLEEIDGMP